MSFAPQSDVKGTNPQPYPYAYASLNQVKSRSTKRTASKKKKDKPKKFDPKTQCWFCRKEVKRCHCKQGQKQRRMFAMFGHSIDGSGRSSKKKSSKTKKKHQTKDPERNRTIVQYEV
jgi:hypothetical protein